MTRPTAVAANETLLGWASPDARDTLLDLQQPIPKELAPDDEAVRTSLALVPYRARPVEDEELFSRCVIEERPVVLRRRSGRPAWIAAGAGLVTIGALVGALLLGSGGAVARGPSWWSPSENSAQVAPKQAAASASRAPAQPSAPAEAQASAPVPPRRIRRSSGLEVRTGAGVAEIWLRHD